MLQFHFEAASTSPWRWIVPLVMLPLSLAWYGGVFAVMGGAWQAPFLPVRILAIVFSIPFLLVGLLPFAIGLVMLRGRTTVRLTSETLRCRWHAGLLGFSRSLATTTIDRIGIEEIAAAPQNPRVRGAWQAPAATAGKVGVARAGGKGLFLTVFLDETAARQVMSLVRTRLEDMGHVLSDV
jgi:hypothetical protein